MHNILYQLGLASHPCWPHPYGVEHRDQCLDTIGIATAAGIQRKPIQHCHSQSQARNMLTIPYPITCSSQWAMASSSMQFSSQFCGEDPPRYGKAPPPISSIASEPATLLGWGLETTPASSITSRIREWKDHAKDFTSPVLPPQDDVQDTPHQPKSTVSNNITGRNAYHRKHSEP